MNSNHRNAFVFENLLQIIVTTETQELDRPSWDIPCSMYKLVSWLTYPMSARKNETNNTPPESINRLEFVDHLDTWCEIRPKASSRRPSAYRPPNNYPELNPPEYLWRTNNHGVIGDQLMSAHADDPWKDFESLALEEDDETENSNSSHSRRLSFAEVPSQDTYDSLVGYIEPGVDENYPLNDDLDETPRSLELRIDAQDLATKNTLTNVQGNVLESQGNSKGSRSTPYPYKCSR